MSRNEELKKKGLLSDKAYDEYMKRLGEKADAIEERTIQKLNKMLGEKLKELRKNKDSLKVLFL